MNNLEIFKNEEFGEIRTAVVDGKIIFAASDIAKALGYKRPNDAVNQHCKAMVKYNIPISGKMQYVNFIPEDDVYRLLTFQRIKPDEYVEGFLEWLKENNIISDMAVLSTKKEVEFVSKLKMSLIPFNLSLNEQYSILTYKIDAYIPELNIAIEYDEDNHKYYTYEEQEYRQSLIESKLGCKFIRVTDLYSDEHNIGFVIKEIMKLLVGNDICHKLIA